MIASILVNPDPIRDRFRAATLAVYRWLLAIIAAAAMALFFGLFAAPLFAQDTMPPAPYAYQQLDDPQQEQAARELMETLRCLKCQSQSIADSDAPMAGDMRHQVRTRIAAGETPGEVRAWLVQRYGDYVSYEPRLTGATWPLFVVPLVVMLIAGLAIGRRMRMRR